MIKKTNRLDGLPASMQNTVLSQRTRTNIARSGHGGKGAAADRQAALPEGERMQEMAREFLDFFDFDFMDAGVQVRLGPRRAAGADYTGPPRRSPGGCIPAGLRL